jgi:hypothetical protein
LHHIRSAEQVTPLAYNLTEAQQISKTSTHKLINLPTQQLTNPSTQILKIIAFILQTLLIFRSVLAKIWVKKQLNSHYF